jgi:hypothetical protein
MTACTLAAGNLSLDTNLLAVWANLLKIVNMAVLSPAVFFSNGEGSALLF